jgi:hypothetical protein
MATIQEIAAELGIPAETLTAKADVVTKWNTHFAEADTETAEAARKLEEAQNLQRAVDDQIAKFAVNESSVIQLQAQLAAVKAAQVELEKNGVKLDLNLPTNVPEQKDPTAALLERVTGGFAQIGQAMAVQNRYFNVYGKALPDDPRVLADEANAHRMSLEAYANQKYSFAAEEQRKAAAASQKQMDDYAATKVKEWQEAHPSVMGHPELNGGMPSGYAAMPKPRETKDVRTFAALPTRDKIADAMRRATEAAKPAA